MSVSLPSVTLASPGAPYSLTRMQGWSSNVLIQSATVPFKDLGAVIDWSESAILSSEYGLDYLA